MPSSRQSKTHETRSAQTNGILQVDSHEKQYVKDSLRDVGLAFQISPLNRAGLGDFFWDTPFGAYSVEHKTVSSLVRDFWNRPTRQLSRQFDSGMNNVLIIEGIIHPSGSGPDAKCHVYRYSGNNKVYYGKSDGQTKVSYNAWTAWKTKVSLSGIHVIECINSHDMALRLLGLYNTSSETEMVPIKSYSAGTKEAHWQENMLYQVPGIGQARAEALLNYYGSLYTLLDSRGQGWPITSPSFPKFIEMLEETAI